MNYNEVFKRSLERPDDFWGEVASDIHWYRKWDKVLDNPDGKFYKWFKGGELNTCYNAVDIHVENGSGDLTAVIYDSPVTDTKEKITYSQLRDRIAVLAGGLKEQGLRKGDTVIIYMPMIPEALISMLACARIGAIHSVVFGGFAPKELAIRIDDAEPKLIITASCGIEKYRVLPYKPLVDEAIQIADHKPEKCVILEREQQKVEPMIEGRDLYWRDVIKDAAPAECIPLDSNHPLYILYTSGTTGKPKGIVRDNGGHAVALKWSMKHIYGMEKGDVYWAASDVGWVVGHSYIVYAPLLLGAATVMFEGKPIGTPDPGAFWRIISEYRVRALFTAPTAIRAIKREDPNGEYMKKFDMSSLDTLFLAGERCDPDTLLWSQEHLGVPVIDHWWQTETGWAIVGNFKGMEMFPVKPGSATKSVPGYDVKILDEDGKEVKRGEQGVIAVKTPLPPGTLITLWNDDERYVNSYLSPYPGYYYTGDGGYMDNEDYVYIMGRVDDIINVAGHRLSTGAMEEILAQNPDVASASVVGANDNLRGEVPVGFVVLKAGSEREQDELEAELVKAVRAEIGPIACFRKVLIVSDLPQTRSGKTLRRTLRSIVNGEDYNIPSTIANPDALDKIKKNVHIIGYGKK